MLALRFFPGKPDLVTAYVREYVSNPNGNVYYEFKVPIDKEHSYAHILNTLAGQVAEQVIYGEFKSGSASDNEQWEQLAKQHLTSGFSDNFAWYISPSNNAEALVNANTLKDLRNKQWAVLEVFLRANKTQLETIACRLMEVKKIETDEAVELIEDALLQRQTAN